MKLFFRLLLFIYLAGSSLLYLLTCLSPYINPLYSQTVYLAGLAFPFITINFSLIVLWHGLIKKKFWFLLFLLPGLFFGLKFFALQGPSDAITEPIRIYSFNAHSGTLFDENSGELNKWQAYINDPSNKPHIFCLQEYYPSASGVFDHAGKMDEYSKEKSNLKILSEFPIVDGGELIDDSGLRFAIYADLKLPDKVIRIYNFHLRSNFITDWLKVDTDTVQPRADRMIAEGEKLIDNIYTASKIRAMEAKKLKWHISSSPYPVVVCGDMNETAQSFVYRQIQNKLNDSFTKGKPGYHPTFLKRPSWVRIDYVFIDEQFEINSYNTLPFKLSDHKILEVEID